MKPEIVVAIITLAGVIFTAFSTIIIALIQRRDRKTLNEVNEAVNNRITKRGPNAKLLYDMVWENHEKCQSMDSSITQISKRVNELPCQVSMKCKEEI